MKFGLENIEALCAELGHPERTFRPVIVAGTNGKGSVTAMVSAALHSAGHRAARYTSPHLLRLEERFVIGEREVDTERLREAAARVREAAQRLEGAGALAGPPTFFECTTAIAFDLFRLAHVELAVLEVGLGGRLDATNVVTPLAAAITSIDLDHQAQLGSTVPEIAREKAGVIKHGTPVVCGLLRMDALEVIEEVCREKQARLVRVGREIEMEATLVRGETTVSIRTSRRTLRDVRLALPGRHQAQNAAVAAGVIDELTAAGFLISDAHAAAGLATARWPARLERIPWRGAEVLLDAAHNPAGARTLAEFVTELGWRDVVVLFGAMRDKDVHGMLEPLAMHARAIVCATAPGRRAASATELAAIARGIVGEGVDVEAVPDPEAALERARGHGTQLVVTGSIFLIGPLRGILR